MIQVFHQQSTHFQPPTPKSNDQNLSNQLELNGNIDIRIGSFTWHVLELWPGLSHLLHRRIVASRDPSPPPSVGLPALQPHFGPNFPCILYSQCTSLTDAYCFGPPVLTEGLIGLVKGAFLCRGRLFLPNPLPLLNSGKNMHREFLDDH